MGRRLVIQPASDAAFAADVGAQAPLNETPEALEAALRKSYPSLVVHNGVEEADGTKRWYVYRDGRWHGP